MPHLATDATELFGIVPSLNTPFDADNGIDEPSIPRLIDYVTDAGCAGALTLAAAGETVHLSAPEWHRIADATCAAAAGRLPILLSVTAPDLEASLERARAARRLKVMGILWQPPAAFGRDEIGDGMVRLSDEGIGSVMLQDLDFVGNGYPVAWIGGWFDAVEGFTSIKIENNDAGPKYTAVQEITGDKLHITGGWAVRTMIDAMERGVAAFIPTGMEPVYVAIDRWWRAGERARAEALFRAAFPALDFATRNLEHSIRFFKRMRLKTGIFSTDRVRVDPPVLSPEDAAEADRLIALAGALEAGLD